MLVAKAIYSSNFPGGSVERDFYYEVKLDPHYAKLRQLNKPIVTDIVFARSHFAELVSNTGRKFQLYRMDPPAESPHDLVTGVFAAMLEGRPEASNDSDNGPLAPGLR